MASTDETVAGVPGRYASALFELASEENTVDQVGADLASFRAAIDDSADLQQLVRSPVFSAEEQIAALEALCKEGQIGGTARNFILLVARNRRLAALPNMITDYAKLVAAARGEVAAEVVSAEALSDQQIADLKSALKEAIGHDVTVSSRVDQSLLGGLIVKVGSRMMDNSLKTKLSNLKIAMKGTA